VVAVDDESFDSVVAKGCDDPSSVKSVISYDDDVIIVRNRLTYDHKRELVLHELIHACLEDSGVAEQLPEAETFVKVLAPRLIQLLDQELVNLLDDVAS